MTISNDLVDALRSAPGLGGLDEGRLAALARIASLSSVAADGAIFEEDAREGDLFFLISGVAELRMRAPGGRNSMDDAIAPVKAGEFAGETAFLDGGRREAGLFARDRCLALRIDGPALKELCEADAELGRSVYAALGRVSAGRYRDAAIELRNAQRGTY